MIAYHETQKPESLSPEALDEYLARGWYRMHQTIFTTTHLLHEELYRVHWLRFPLSQIRSHTSHRRIRRLNASCKVVIEDVAAIQPEHEELYRRYRESINFEGASSIHHSLNGEEESGQTIFRTKSISVFDNDKLIAAGYFDLGQTAGTSILHFFDPACKGRSLGKYLVLLTVDFLQSEGYEYYYPGYVVAGNNKMDYKLFLGKEAACYFDPASGDWLSFSEAILNPELMSEAGKLEIVLAFLE